MAGAEKKSRFRAKPLIQAAFFSAFTALLCCATWPVASWLLPGLFMHSDPAFVLLAAAASGVLTGWAALSLLTAAVTLVFGRVYCGYACPAGAMLDLAGRLCAGMAAGRRVGRPAAAGLLRIKHLVFTVLLVSAALGVQYAFLSDHMAIVERAGSAGISFLTGRPGAGGLISAFAFLILMLSLSLAAPRGWCRYACPNGALLSLLSAKPAWRRRVGEGCDGCGVCTAKCPSGCISDRGDSCNHMECYTCRTCERVCPKGAVRFSFSSGRAAEGPEPVWESVPSRREMLSSILAGAVAAAAGHAGIGSTSSVAARPVRPPAAIPERDFLAACMRCGLCSRACVTGTIEPAMLQAGAIGFMSPVISPRKAGCEPLCTACGDLCPTGAIRHVDAREKRWARIGTARIDKQRCLSWKQGLNCLVCQEHCPNRAVRMVERRGEGAEAVQGGARNAPVVKAARCNGCGMCEAACPVIGASAITVTAEGEIRLAAGSYIEAAGAMGLDLDQTSGDDALVPDGFVN